MRGLKMKRITISFYEEIYDKLEARMQKNESASIAQSVRELVDLGLRIEEAAAIDEEKNDENSVEKSILELKNLLKNNLNWALETRLLTRLLVEHNINDHADNKAAILEKYKKSATDYIKGLYGEILD